MPFFSCSIKRDELPVLKTKPLTMGAFVTFSKYFKFCTTLLWPYVLVFVLFAVKSSPSQLISASQGCVAIYLLRKVGDYVYI